METPTATATNPTDASASSEASAATLATAGSAAGTTQQPDPAKPAAEAAATTAATPAATDTPATPGTPEKYDFKAPEGTEYDPEIVESFSGAAKKAGLTQDAAQKLIEEMAPALAARTVDQVAAIHKEWVEASSADKEFGGEKLQQNLAVAKRSLDAFDPIPPDAKTTPLRTLLDETGLGNHPEMIRLLYRAGKAISEDHFVGGSPAGAGKANPAEVLYDKTNAQKA